jgi:hypothetical protein
MALNCRSGVAICYKPESVGLRIFYRWFCRYPQPLGARKYHMSIRHKPTHAAAPRWDGTRVAFQIDVDGAMVDCAISRSALQDLGGYRHFTPADLLRCFNNARARIEAVAAEKFAAQACSVYGVVSIWSDDLEDAPLSEAEISKRLQGKKRHGKGTEARQSGAEETKGQQEAGAGHVNIPAPERVAAGS